MYKKVENVKETRGILKAWDKDTVTVECEGKDFTVERKNIARLVEYVDWDS